ncbi:MAG TPA: GntR family transcriptional regulator [Acidobacteriota bacterium]|nr:GntR family transcriptional regulator [Acidobacteriota bacterium]
MTEIRFTVDKDCGLPLYEQVKGQLLSGLYTGKLKPGDRLPSVREMARHASINLKSAQRIYQKLSQENYVEIHKASGVFVRERDQQTYDRMRRKAIHKLISETLDRARGLGISAEQLRRLIENFSTGKNLRRIVLTVVDHEEEADIFSSEIRERVAPADVYVLSLGKHQNGVDRSALEKSEYILTTSWHLDAVQGLAARFGKPVLEIRPNPQISTEILEVARTRNVALIVKDENTMHASWDLHMTLFHPSTDKKFFICPIDKHQMIRQILKEAETIYVTPACWDEMRKMTPAHVELKTFQSFISDETIETLREIQLYD